MQIFAIAYFAVLGAYFGSFANVVGYRLPLGMSLMHPGSRCSSCGTPLTWRDNIPVFGWLMVWGHCRHCNSKFSPRYMFYELITAICCGAIGAMTDFHSLWSILFSVGLCVAIGLIACLVSLQGNFSGNSPRR
jgi:prepilin signal peptidase PulO-like enzyme (type II secretory pathway)